MEILQRRVATVQLTVLDKNDNSPVFVYNQTYNDVIEAKYMTIVDQSTEVGIKMIKHFTFINVNFS